MGALELEYTVKHPYPRSKMFTVATCVLVLLVLPVLVLVNVVTVGYELVPSLQSEFAPKNTNPSWTRFLRRRVPLCEPKDLGKGDVLRLTPSLFEYQILSSWRTSSTHLKPEDEGRIEYRGIPFHNCSVYEMLFDHSTAQRTQTITVAVTCPEYPLRLYLDTSIALASDFNKDIVGQYYGYDMQMQNIDDEDPRDYHRAVFGILDVLSTDSLGVMLGQHLAAPVSELSVAADVISETNLTFRGGTIVYQNGNSTELGTDNTLAEAEVYRASITNIMLAVHHAVELDLGNPSSGNVYINSAAVNDTFSPNLAPPQIGRFSWMQKGSKDSFAYGDLIPPYQTWAEMLRAGLPKGIPLGDLSGLPPHSTMRTNYLCPIYRLKPTGTLLANVFIGTATMFLSVWAAWMTLSAIIAKRMQDPCMVCNCRNPMAPEEGIAQHAHGYHHDHSQAPCCGTHVELNRDSVAFASEKGDPKDSIQELPKTGPVTRPTLGV